MDSGLSKVETSPGSSFVKQDFITLLIIFIFRVLGKSFTNIILSGLNDFPKSLMIKSAKKSALNSSFSSKGTMDSIILDPLLSSGIPTEATSITFPL